MNYLKSFSIILISFAFASTGIAADNYWDKSISPKESYNFADAPPGTEGGQNTATLVEGKFMRKVEEAYVRRDEQEFERLYNLFLVSFPGSERREEVENYRRLFFYNEKLKAYLLSGDYVKLDHLNAKTEKELNQLFNKMKQIAIGAVEIEMVQMGGKKGLFIC